MISSLLDLLCLAVGAVSGALLLIYLIGANIYDVRTAKLQRDLLRQPHARRNRHRPLITAVVITRNDGPGAETTVRSLLAADYRKLEIIIVDNASKNDTGRVLRGVVAAHPKRALRLVRGRKPAYKRLAAFNAYRRYGHGDMVLLLEAGQALERRALLTAVRHGNAEPGIDALVLNRRVGPARTVVGVLHSYESLLRNRVRKFTSLLWVDYMLPDDEAILCTRDAFKRIAKGESVGRTQYASDTVVHERPAPSLDALLSGRYRLQLARWQALTELGQPTMQTARMRTRTWLRLTLAYVTGAMALAAPLVLGYFVYLALRLHEPTFFTLSLACFSIFLLLTIWGDEYLRPREKIVRSIGLPLTFGLFALFAFVQPLVLLIGLVSSLELQSQTSVQKPITV
jgi:hypothetical protein